MDANKLNFILYTDHNGRPPFCISWKYTLLHIS